MRWLSWLIVVCVCVVIAGSLGYYKYAQVQAAIARGQAFPEPAEAVEKFVVQQVTRRPALTVTGEVVATQSAMLRNELAGRVVEVGFAPGAEVQAGQLLLRLSTAQESAQLAEARAEQQIATLALNRAERLVKSGAGSVETRDQARAQAEAARARVSALSALIEKNTLRAPFNAIASLHQLELGQFLDAGTEVTELIGLADYVWIDFALPQDSVRIDLGSRVEIESSGQSERLSAQVVARDAAVNVRSRNLRLRAQLPSETTDLLPGMLVEVHVPLRLRETVHVVPVTAVRRDALGTSVYVLQSVEENGQVKMRARKRKVTLASRVQLEEVEQTQDGVRLPADLVIVTSGIAVGEEIAAVGAFKLRDGALVVASEPNLAAQDRSVGR